MRWPLQPLQPLQQTQLQPPFGQSVDSLCHPWFTTTNVSYRFPILKLPPPPCAVLLVRIYNALHLIKTHVDYPNLWGSESLSYMPMNVTSTSSPSLNNGEPGLRWSYQLRRSHHFVFDSSALPAVLLFSFSGGLVFLVFCHDFPTSLQKSHLCCGTQPRTWLISSYFLWSNTYK